MSCDPILNAYLKGKPSGGVYCSNNLNLYHYANNNPVLYVDPTGEAHIIAGNPGSLGGAFIVREEQITPPYPCWFDVMPTYVIVEVQHNYDGEEYSDTTTYLRKCLLNYILTGDEKYLDRIGHYDSGLLTQILYLELARLEGNERVEYINMLMMAAAPLGMVVRNELNRVASSSSRYIYNQSIIDRKTGKVVQSGTIDLKSTLLRIKAGLPFNHRNDGSVFTNREGLLPTQPHGYYREFVHPTPGIKGPGPQRIIVGQGGEIYYSPDHYQTFIQVK